MLETALTRYLDELYRWNVRINLTTVSRERAWARHVGESQQLLSATHTESGWRCADIGSGGGIPGLVLALLRADLRVTLIESDQRKAGFLVHAAAICGSTNTDVLAERAEVVGRDPAHRCAYDLVTSRATASSPVLIELGLPLLRVGGRLAALVRDAASEVSLCRVAAQLCGGATPTALAPNVLGVDKIAETPELYPRRVGVPRRKPLC